MSQPKIDDVQVDLTAYAPKDSPALTGNPTATNQAASNNSQRIATTYFVKIQGYAPLAAPLFTGNARLANPPLTGDNDNSIVTSAWVKSQGYSSGGSGFDSGQVWTSNLYASERFVNTTYPNNYGHPIEVHVLIGDGGSLTNSLYVGIPGTMKQVSICDAAGTNGDDTLSAIVPPGHSFHFAYSSGSSLAWYELR